MGFSAPDPKAATMKFTPTNRKKAHLERPEKRFLPAAKLNTEREIKMIKNTKKKPAGKKTIKRNADAQKILAFFHELGILKKVPRTGWLWRNIPDCESIADHCYRVNIIAMTLCDYINSRAKKPADRLDFEKVMRMSVLHEICECRTGDIPYPAQKYIGSHVKTAAETAAVRDITGPLGFMPAGYYSDLWLEFENGASPEGKLVKAADKLELLLQAVEYEKAGAKTLGDFWENDATFRQIAFHPAAEELLAELLKMRD